MAVKPSERIMVPLPSHSIVPIEDMHKAPVLQTHQLGIDFGGLTAVNNLNLAIGPTEICGLIGPNGAGKTTVFNLLTSVYQPTRGTILLDGYDTKGKSCDQVSKMGIARTFQNIRLFGKMSVMDNVKIGMHNQLNTNLFSSVTHGFGYKQTEKQAYDKAKELLDFFGMADLRHNEAGSLPYGAQRRLEIVRALATNPKILLLDEPAAGMNPNETLELMETIRFVRDKFNITILLIEHDMKLVSGICEELTVLNFGKVLAQGKTSDVLNDPQVITAYLGE